MKKLFVIFASIALVAAFALSASAEWSMYGSARMGTFMEDSDTGAPGGDDDDLIWDLANSRVGATAKNDAVKGQIEMSVAGAGGGNNVGTRRLYGEWDIGSPKLKVGQDYSPVKQFISGQVFGGDAGLLGNGTAYGSRNPQLALNFGTFEIALLQPKSAAVAGLTATDVDETLPKVEAGFYIKQDAFFVDIIAGYNSFDIEGPAGVSDVGVDSYMFGAAAGMNFGPAYVKVCGSMYSNGGNAGWAGAGAADANAAGTDVEDSDTTAFAGVVGFKASDKMTLEAGMGIVQREFDLPGKLDDDETAWYAQAVIALAPGVWVIPEIGGYDDLGANDKGDSTYFGAKWQIDF